MHLFEILNVVRSLQPPDQVEAILRAHPEVAEAAKVYPNGLEDLFAQRPPAAKRTDPEQGFVYASSGSATDRRLVAGMMAAHRGDPSAIQHLLDEARRIYGEDTGMDPNLAPRVFWPSCHAYKVAMNCAGKSLGMDAEPLLAELPDSDFALLASIELVAGVWNVPQHAGVWIQVHPNRTHRIG